MTRISGTDHLLLLLQEQIGKFGKDKAGRRVAGPVTPSATAAPMDRLRAIASREGVSDEELRRALVRALLVRQLGEALGNDPAFEAMAGDVLRTINESPEGPALLDRAMRQLMDRSKD